MTHLNSISEHMDAETILAELRMERQAFSGSFILFEGIKDARRFERFFDSEECSFVICWGKRNLKNTFLLTEESSLEHYLALMDSDFDNLLGGKIESPNIIYSKSHDFDLDSISTNVFDRYLKEFAKADECEKVGGAEEIRLAIASRILELSLIRFSNFTQDNPRPLSKIDWSNCFDGEKFDTDRFIAVVLKKENPVRADIERFKKTHLCENGYCIWQLTNGHDFFTALGICLSKTLANRKAHQTHGHEIERHIRFGLTDTDFREMSICDEIVAWSSETGNKVLADQFV